MSVVVFRSCGAFFCEALEHLSENYPRAELYLVKTDDKLQEVPENFSGEIFVLEGKEFAPRALSENSREQLAETSPDNCFILASENSPSEYLNVVETAQEINPDELYLLTPTGEQFRETKISGLQIIFAKAKRGLKNLSLGVVFFTILLPVLLVVRLARLLFNSKKVATKEE